MTTRDERIALLVYDDLAKGKGTHDQLCAYRELEWRRCSRDPVYFLNKYGWLIVKEGGISKLTLWPRQRTLVADLNEGKSICAVKARQLGVTTVLILFRLWQVIFLDAAQNNFVSDSEEKGKEAMKKMAATYDRLPKWMKERAASKAKTGDVRRKDKKEGTLGISFGLSELKVLTSTPNSVAGVSGNIDLDEFGRHRDQRRVLDNAIPAFQGGGQIVVIGNGNGEDELFNLYQQASRGEFPGMQSYFFSWKDDPSRISGEYAPYLTRGDDICPYEEGQIVPDGWTLIYPWYEETKKMYLRDNPDKDIYSFKAQYPSTIEEAFYLTGDTFFDLKMVNGLSQLSTRQYPLKAELRNQGEDEHFIERFSFSKHSSGKYRVYRDPEPGRAYVAGIDPTGDGKNGDYAVITICELVRGEEVRTRADEYGYLSPPVLDNQIAFEWRDTDYAMDVACVFQARMEPVVFSQEVERVCRHYNDAFAVIERNNSGGTVVSHIKNTYWNLYKQVKEEKFADDFNDIIGYWETEASKKRMLDNLNYWLSSGWIFLHDSPTIAELSKFGYDDRGRLRSPKGMHDDLVFGLGLAVVGARDMQITKTGGDEVNFGLEW